MGKTIIENDVGYTYKSEKTRKITVEDINLYMELGQSPFALWEDDDAGREVGFDKRVVPGPMHPPVAFGLLSPILSEQSFLVGINNVLFVAPLYPGDTVSVKARLLEKRQTSKGDWIGTYSWSLINQDGVEVSRGENT